MKFRNADKRTKRFLEQWASAQPLIIGTHYFWSSGSSIQKSWEGLLTSLLFQILSACPDLIKKVAPPSWFRERLPCRSPKFPLKSERRQAFCSLIEVSACKANIFLIIDGLDEYHGPSSELIELLTMLKDASRKPHVKICVSSRPDTRFEKAFKGKPSLLL